MIGQGSPNASRGHFPPSHRGAICRRHRFILAIVLAFCVRGAAADEQTLRVRVAWGGGAPALWQGVIAVSDGSLSEPRPLGIEADEPGSMWLAQGPVFAVYRHQQVTHPLTRPEMNHLVIRQRSPHTYDGVDLLVTAPPEANLLIALSAPSSRKEAQWITVPLARLIDGFFTADLDERGNRLVVRRSPGDMLRVSLGHSSVVFWPGETLKFQLQPHLPVEPGTKVQLKVELMEARASSGRLVAEHSVVAGQHTPIQQEIRLPSTEGVYDVVVTATHPAWRRLTQPVRGKQPLAVRRIQVVVLRPEPPIVPVGVGTGLLPVEEIDPVSPWWEKLTEKLAKLPQPQSLWRLPKGPLGNGHSQAWKHPLGQVVRLGPTPQTGDVAWEAYTLPVDKPGRPHVFEIDYPSDVPQTFGACILEPNAKGTLFPIGLESGADLIGLDSGIDLAEEVTGRVRKTQWLRHRVIFWPKTKSPLVLITNRRDGSPAVYGKIRLLDAGEHLPRAFPVHTTQPQRLLAGYLDRPLFPENFSASEAVTPSSDMGMDDWVTFHEGGTRLVEYLNHVGFGGLMISVLADGSTIYPSTVLDPTPRYDTGVFLEAAQDPVRKDVLEMLFRLFDREGLQLIPAMEFAAPLPELEALLRRGGPESQGIEWVGEDGKTWLETHRPVRGMAPYYNVLHPRVQEAMLAAILEVVRRYGHHRSFAGVGIQLSGNGYAQLPGPGWGLDDATIARFEHDMRIQVPGEGPERFAQRALFLAPPDRDEAPYPDQPYPDRPYPDQWLRWRAEQLNRFYRRAEVELRAVRSDARLYLAGANMLAGPELERALKPVLPRRMTVAEAMLRVGIDIHLYGQDDGVVLLRPERVAPTWSLARQAVNLEIQQMLQAEQKPEMKRPFEDALIPGSLFFHQPQGIHLTSFDQQSPFKSTYTWLATQPVPSDWQNRRRFVGSLAAIDSQVMFDGGWQLPMGQEDSIRELVAAYRRLPAVPFQRLSDPSGSDATQPVTIRHADYAGATYVYLVNDAPFDTMVRVDVAAPRGSQIEELSRLRRVERLVQDATGAYWTVKLRPYDLVAVRFSTSGVTLSNPQVYWSEQVQAELEARIAELVERTGTIRSDRPPPLDVLENPRFELPPTGDGQIPGWATSSEAGGTVELDASVKNSGERAVRVASRGPVTSLLSQPFDPPSTGRLTLAVYLRASEAPDQAPLRVALEGNVQGRRFAPCALLGKVGTEWSLYAVRFRDLPLEGLSPVRLRFDLMGQGEVWIDDVQLCHLAFDHVEKIALVKLIAPANLMLENGQVGDCIQLLEGYWPRFLLVNVPPTAARMAHSPEPARRPTKQPQGSPSFFERMKALVPRKLPFF